MKLKQFIAIQLAVILLFPPLLFGRPAKNQFEFNAQSFKPGSTLKINIKPNRKIKEQKIVFNSGIYNVYQESPGVQRALIGIPVTIEPGVYEVEFEYKRYFFNYRELAGIIYVEKEEVTPRVQNIRFSERVKALYKSPSVLDGSDQKLLNDAYSTVSSVQLWEDTFELPIKSRVTSRFGASRSYNVGGSVTSYHRGTDFSAPLGSDIKAANSGAVILTRNLALSGKSVAIDHGQGVVSVYKHLSEILVNEGDFIRKNDVLGLAGSTGLSTAPHLHWEVRVFGVPVNPIEWTENVY